MERSFALEPFDPPKLLEGKHIQTIYRAIFTTQRELNKSFRQESIILSTDDGDSLWIEHAPPLATYKKNVPATGHYIILIHGMEGDASSPYIVSLAEAALKDGYGVVRMNLRGCGKGGGLAVKSYNAGCSEDIDIIIKYVYKNFCKKIILSGFSLSANIVLKFLGEKTRKEIKYFSAISPPLDLKRNCEYIDSEGGRFYRDYFLFSFRNKIKSGIVYVEPDIKEKGLNAKTLFDYDDMVTGPMFGYKGALEYYKHCSSIRYIHNIKQKGIVIHAKDDPLIPHTVFESIDWTRVPWITAVLTEKGGHVGFITKKTEEIPDRNWLNYTILNYFNALV